MGSPEDNTVLQFRASARETRSRHLTGGFQQRGLFPRLPSRCGSETAASSSTLTCPHVNTRSPPTQTVCRPPGVLTDRSRRGKAAAAPAGGPGRVSQRSARWAHPTRVEVHGGCVSSAVPSAAASPGRSCCYSSSAPPGPHTTPWHRGRGQGGAEESQTPERRLREAHAGAPRRPPPAPPDLAHGRPHPEEGEEPAPLTPSLLALAHHALGQHAGLRSRLRKRRRSTLVQAAACLSESSSEMSWQKVTVWGNSRSNSSGSPSSRASAARLPRRRSGAEESPGLGAPTPARETGSPRGVTQLPHPGGTPGVGRAPAPHPPRGQGSEVPVGARSGTPLYPSHRTRRRPDRSGHSRETAGRTAARDGMRPQASTGVACTQEARPTLVPGPANSQSLLDPRTELPPGPHTHSRSPPPRVCRT